MRSAPAAHWDQVWAGRDPESVTWYQADAGRSFQLVTRAAPDPNAAVVDVGGGASRLVDRLLDRGYTDLTVADIAATALAASQARLGARAAGVTWVAADVTAWDPGRRFDLWHDRAVFHFLTDPADRAAYRTVAARTVRPGGHLVIGTFAADGPEQCSGLPVVRYGAEALAAALAPGFEPVAADDEWHRAPSGACQHFTFVTARRRP